MSWLRLSIIPLVLLTFGSDAQAGGRVDWSSYIDHDAKPTPHNSVTTTESEAPAKSSRNVAKKQVASKSKSRARAKAKARARAKNSRRK